MSHFMKIQIAFNLTFLLEIHTTNKPWQVFLHNKHHDPFIIIPTRTHLV